ncbi:MAG: hypothetical protein LBD22_05500 [Spirochaetaceae bacterium]|jgi:hypothetical protein|nr:hypothetical protein [Spirochaetaceae bacterium]
MNEETRPANGNARNEHELQFYYNRDARLAKASERVRALYDGQPKRKIAFFSSLTDTKPKAAMFISIVVMCLMILFISNMTSGGNDGNLAGNTISAHVMRYNGASFIVLKKQRLRADAWADIVDISMARPDAEKSKLSSKQIVFTTAETEEFRWTLPFETPRLIFFLSAGNDTQRLAVTSD